MFELIIDGKFFRTVDVHTTFMTLTSISEEP